VPVLATAEMRSGDTRPGLLPDGDRTAEDEVIWTHWDANQYALVDDGAFIWIGTAMGALRWNKATRTFQRYTQFEGFPSTHVYAVAVDGAGNRWFGGDGGLSLLDAGGEWTYYSAANSGLARDLVDGIAVAGKRANLVAQMKQIGLFQVAYTDFTELVYANGAKKAYLMPIIAHRCKVAYGWAVGERADTSLALAAWNMAKRTFSEYDIPCHRMIMHHDQDSVYTGFAWTHQVLLVDGLRLSYALNGYKDNPEMESFNGRFKTENGSLFLEATCLPELQAIVQRQMDYYNQVRRHSSLGYLSPLRYMRQKQS